MQTHFFSQSQSADQDRIGESLKGISQNVLSVIFGLLPILFLPVAFLPIDYLKVIFVVVALFVSIIFFSLSVLRSGRVRVAAPMAVWAFIGIAMITFLSALLSGDFRDAFFGNFIEVHTALFILLLALVVIIPLFFEQSKISIMRFYILLTASAGILALYHVLRLFFGAHFLSLGVFSDSASTPVGGWNDLALFFGLSILLSLVALEQLPLTRWGKGIFSVGIALSLLMLSVINFFAVWIVLALVSLVLMMYGLTKDRFSEQSLHPGDKKNISVHSIVLSSVVFIVSLIFIVGGSSVGNLVSQATGVSYVEVRPSMQATVDIARNVYHDNAFLGIGPNKFDDAWRMYKDRSINNTIFWSTDFRGGSGYIPTLFVTTGIFGSLMWLLFIVLFLYTGFRMLFKTTHADRFWYFIGSSSFVAAVYLWGMSLVYVPGATILLLAAMFTSISFVSYVSLTGTRGFAFSLANNRRAGLVLVGAVMIVILISSGALYYVVKEYSASYAFASAVSGVKPGTTLDSVEQQIAQAYAFTNNDLYARQIASYQLGKMNTLLNNAQKPTQEQQQEFQKAVQQGLSAANTAVSTDPTDPVNWSLLGNMYGILAAVGVDGAKDKALNAYDTAIKYDPQNPSYPLAKAQMYAQIGDNATARTSIQDAIKLKGNYTDALYLLTQIDISEGKTDAAIATTKSIISIEPNNPARYYQLGVLQSATNDTQSAIASFQHAISLDKNYANARYFLALAYLQNGQKDEALQQLDVVAQLNPKNQQVQTLIDQVKSGNYTAPSSAPTTSIQEPDSVSQTDEGVTTTQAPDTPLVTPVNTVDEGDQSPDTAATSSSSNATSSEQ